MCRKLLVCFALVAVLGNQFLQSEALPSETNNGDDGASDDRVDALVNAIFHSNITEVKRLIDEGADVNAKTSNQDALLHTSIFLGEGDIVKFLVERGADVNIKDGEGQTPLIICVKNRGTVAAVDFLINNGADVNAKDNNGLTALHHAVQHCSKKIIKKLLSKMDDIDAKTRHGLTPLHLAATYEGSVHFRLETLVENGAKVNERSQYGSTPLDFAAAFGEQGAVDSLTKSGAQRGNNNDTPLHLAAREGLLEKVEDSLRKGADLDAKIDGGFTALHLAAMNGHTKIAEHLVKNGANVNAVTDQGETPLRLAEENGHTETAEYLRSLVTLRASVN